MTYSAFLSLFPLLAVATAVTFALLGQHGVDTVNEHVRKQLPSIAGESSLEAVAANAATVGVISALILTWTGLSWVNTARGSMREIWGVDDMPGNFFGRKAADLASLVGLGLSAAVVLSASVLTSGLATHVLRWLRMADTTVARSLLWLIGTLLGIGAGTVMFAYVLSGIPRLTMPHGVLLSTALAASVLFDITKSLIGSYLSSVAGRSLYGAFGVPIALLVWFDLTFVTTLFLSAWTATRTEDALRAERARTAGTDRVIRG
jgi:membrane protein